MDITLIFYQNGKKFYKTQEKNKQQKAFRAESLLLSNVPRQGFEPRLDEPKSSVLPLHHQGMFEISKKNGDDRVRTDDPHNAIVVLFQLSYIPVKDLFITPHRPTCVNLYFYFFSTTFLLFFCPSASIFYFSAEKIRLGRFFIYLSFFRRPQTASRAALREGTQSAFPL